MKLQPCILLVLLVLAKPSQSQHQAVVTTDGKVVTADGTVVRADGTAKLADGTVVKADGTVVTADGTVVRADGTVKTADGTVVRTTDDGRLVITDSRGTDEAMINDLMRQGSEVEAEEKITRILETSVKRPTGDAAIEVEKKVRKMLEQVKDDIDIDAAVEEVMERIRKGANGEAASRMVELLKSKGEQVAEYIKELVRNGWTIAAKKEIKEFFKNLRKSRKDARKKVHELLKNMKETGDVDVEASEIAALIEKGNDKIAMGRVMSLVKKGQYGTAERVRDLLQKGNVVAAKAQLKEFLQESREQASKEAMVETKKLLRSRMPSGQVDGMSATVMRLQASGKTEQAVEEVMDRLQAGRADFTMKTRELVREGKESEAAKEVEKVLDTDSAAEVEEKVQKLLEGGKDFATTVEAEEKIMNLHREGRKAEAIAKVIEFLKESKDEGHAVSDVVSDVIELVKKGKKDDAREKIREIVQGAWDETDAGKSIKDLLQEKAGSLKDREEVMDLLREKKDDAALSSMMEHLRERFFRAKDRSNLMKPYMGHGKRYSEYKKSHPLLRKKKMMDFEDETKCPAVRKQAKKELMRARLTAQAIVNNKELFNARVFETDMFNELAWRSPCKKPTHVKINRICNLASTAVEITAEDLADEVKCAPVDTDDDADDAVDANDADDTSTKKGEKIETMATRLATILQASNLAIQYDVGVEQPEDAELIKAKVEETMQDKSTGEGVASTYVLESSTYVLESSTPVGSPQAEEKEDDKEAIVAVVLAAVAALGAGLCIAGFIASRKKKEATSFTTFADMEQPMEQPQPVNNIHV